LKIKITRRVALQRQYEFVELEATVSKKKSREAIITLENLAIIARSMEVYPK